MPLITKKMKNYPLLNNKIDNNNNNNINSAENGANNHHYSNINNNYNSDNNSSNVNDVSKQQLQQQQQQQQQLSSSLSHTDKVNVVFHCQLAHGSPIGLISNFSSVRELYKKISECYDISPKEILFCTLNSHKIDVTKLLGGQIALDDFIFVHQKGQPKEIEILKTEDVLGLTITDNGAGLAFIKRIKNNSLVSRIPQICVGDHIEKLNGVSMVGIRHFQLAKALKDIKTGTTFTLRLVEPLKSGFQNIGPRTQLHMLTSNHNSYSTGRKTLRFKANGNMVIEETFDEITQYGIDAINNLLESFMGISDTELAMQIWEMGINKNNSMDFADEIDNSDLETFGFNDDFIIELWGAITDAKRKKCLNKN